MPDIYRSSIVAVTAALLLLVSTNSATGREREVRRGAQQDTYKVYDRRGHRTGTIRRHVTVQERVERARQERRDRQRAIGVEEDD
jgi:hypothetical protein